MRHSFIRIGTTDILFCLLLLFSAVLPFRLAAAPAMSFHDVSAAPAVDPNKEPSELNHHIAGIFLVAIGLSIIASKRYQSLAWLRWLPPILFIVAGLFLAAWSDSEIWPRGDLSWSWLLHHDAEARQHKLYALLLIAIGCVEGMQLVPRFRRPWLRVALPILCVVGGVALFFHNHSGEASADATTQTMPSTVLESPVQHHAAARAPLNASEHEHYAGASSHDLSSQANQAKAPATHSHEHSLTAAEAKIQKEHAWFAVIGFWVALSKFLYDSASPAARAPRYLWATSVIVLGFLLLLYSE